MMIFLTCHLKIYFFVGKVVINMTHNLTDVYILFKRINILSAYIDLLTFILSLYIGITACIIEKINVIMLDIIIQKLSRK